MKKVQVDNSNPTTKRKSLVKKLKTEENGLILQLNSLFPYGLNDLFMWMQPDAEEQFLPGACLYKIFSLFHNYLISEHCVSELIYLLFKPWCWVAIPNHGVSELSQLLNAS